MNNNYDYKESLSNIKANLFDIYEDQEKIIGLEENDNIRNDRVNKFIEIKDMALQLIQKVEAIYGDREFVLGNSQQQINMVNDSEPVEIGTNNVVDENSDGNEEESDEEETSDETEEEFDEEETSDSNIERYYLDSDFDKVNYAYVPKSVYETIKENGTSFNTASETEEENVEDLNLYKEDNEKARGIIVRNDQYMKLALSKHRQEEVLKEAKEYRKKEVIKKQREEQKRELEKAKLEFNI